MKLYKDTTGNVFGFDAWQKVPDNLTELTPKEVEDHTRPPPPVPKTQFTSLEYLDRFTDTEQDAIIAAAGQNVQVKKYYDRLLAATFIDLDDPRTEMGIDALIGVGLVDAGRKTALMTPA